MQRSASMTSYASFPCPRVPAPYGVAGHFAATADTVLIHASDGRLLLAGAQVQQDGRWMLRAVDLRAGMVAWETLHGRAWPTPPGVGQLAVRSSRLYVAHAGQLVSIEFDGGGVHWMASLPGEVSTRCDRATDPDPVQLLELAVAGTSGVVIVATDQGLVLGYDRDRGQRRWQAQFEPDARLSGCPGVAVIVHEEHATTVLRPSDGACIVRYSADDTPSYTGGAVLGSSLLLEVEGLGDDEEGSGVALVDAATGRMLAMRSISGARVEPAPVMAGGRIVCTVDAGKPGRFVAFDPYAVAGEPGLFARLWGKKPGSEHRAIGMPTMRITTLIAAGPMVLMMLEPSGGEGPRRIIGLDAMTLAPRFDSGALSHEPSSMVTAQLHGSDRLFVYVTSPTDDEEHCELRAVSTTGQPLWTAPIGAWRHHVLRGGHVVAYGAMGSVLVFDASSGQRVAAYPLAR